MIGFIVIMANIGLGVVFLIASTSVQAETLNLKEFQITMSPAYESTPTLGNDGVSDLVGYSMMVPLPGGAFASIQVPTTGAGSFRPSIHGDLVAYESNVLGNLDIFLYRLSDGETFRMRLIRFSWTRNWGIIPDKEGGGHITPPSSRPIPNGYQSGF